MRSVEAYVAPIVIGLTAVFITIPVPAEKFVVITGDNIALPVDIDNPLPTVSLLIRLKYGISILPVPSKLTFAIVLVVASFVAFGATYAVLISILLVDVLFVKCEVVLNILMRSDEAYVELIIGANIALPVVIDIPVPAVSLLIRLKYGISILPVPSKLTFAIVLVVASFVAFGATYAVLISILLVDVLFVKCEVVLNILMRSDEAYVASIVIGLTAVFITIPVPAEKFVVITGDNIALPVDIDNPLPTVSLLIRLKYGISIKPAPEPVIIPDSFKLPDISTLTVLLLVPIPICPPSNILKHVAPSS